MSKVLGKDRDFVTVVTKTVLSVGVRLARHVRNGTRAGSFLLIKGSTWAYFCRAHIDFVKKKYYWTVWRGSFSVNNDNAWKQETVLRKK